MPLASTFASAGVIMSGVGVRNAAPASAIHIAGKYECFTDDGYGRKFPCSARYKREHPNWRQSNECFTDEGYGRMRPCDSFFRSGQPKN